MADDDDSEGFVFSTEQENTIEGVPEDVQRFWDKMYRVCAKEIVSYGRQFESKRAIQQFDTMLEHNQEESAVRNELLQQKQKVLKRQDRNQFLLQECFQRYMISYKIFQEVAQPNFISELEFVNETIQ